MYHIYDAIIILCSDPFGCSWNPNFDQSMEWWSNGVTGVGFTSPGTMTMAIIHMDDLKKEITYLHNHAYHTVKTLPAVRKRTASLPWSFASPCPVSIGGCIISSVGGPGLVNWDIPAMNCNYHHYLSYMEIKSGRKTNNKYLHFRIYIANLNANDDKLADEE